MFKLKLNSLNFMGVAGTVLGIASSLLGTYTQNKHMEDTIEKKVAEAIAKHTNIKES